MRLPAILTKASLKSFRNNSAILMYHGVGGPDESDSNVLGKHVPVDLFSEQMAFLQSHFKILPLDELIRSLAGGIYPKNCLAITFDDGYQNIYQYAYPILKTKNIPATVYLATGFIDIDRWALSDIVEYTIVNSKRRSISIPHLDSQRDFTGNMSRLELITHAKKFVKNCEVDKTEVIVEQIRASCGVELPAPFGNYQFLRWDQIRIMSENGISFAPHTVNHVILSKCSRARAVWEIIESKRHVEQSTGRVALSFCYPNGMRGDFNETTIACVRQHFSCALSARLGTLNRSDLNLFDLQRVGVTRSTTVSRLLRVLFSQMARNDIGA